MTATELTAKCLAILDEVERPGEVIAVTKRGRQVALLGTVAPVLEADTCDAVRGDRIRATCSTPTSRSGGSSATSA